jgi:hypothetical protein
MADIKVKSAVTIGTLTRWFGVCYICNHALPPLESTARRYFVEGTVECIGCHTSVDLWECSRSQVSDEFPPEWGLQGLGAEYTVFPFEVRPGQVITIDLTQHGIPSDAILLYSSYNSNDARVIPRLVELFSKHLALDPRHQAVYCMPVPGAPIDPGPGMAYVCWVRRGSKAQWSIRSANAFRDIASHDLEGAIVEAFSALEIALFTFTSRYLDRACSSKALRRTLDGRLSAYAMMQLLPGICEELNLRPLAKPVGEALQALRRCRNGILHRGNDNGLSAARVGELLAAAVLGVAFVEYIESRAV